MTGKEALKEVEECFELLELLKNKWVNIEALIDSECVEEYNDNFTYGSRCILTEDEYNKIKEWLKSE